MTPSIYRPLLALSGVLLAAWLFIAWPVSHFAGRNTKPATLAMLVQLVVGLWTLRLTWRARKAEPALQVVVLAGNAMIRMIFPVVAGAFGWYLISDLQGRELELVVWFGLFGVVVLIFGSVIAGKILSS